MYRLVYITAKDEKEAEKIATILVEEKLAACANIFPIRSIYSWKSEIVKDEEVAMVLKTKRELVGEIIEKVKELHSYEVPCIISLALEEGYTKFLEWIHKSTKVLAESP